MKKMIIIDNEIIYKKLKGFINGEAPNDIVLYHSGKLMGKSDESFFNLKDTAIDIRNNIKYIKENFDLIISVHCRQIFPKEIIQSVRCINLHPGYNPSTRGWFPQVFAIIHDLPIGATLHEMDELIDHGPIVARKLVEKNIYDTSYTLYNKILKAEVELFIENFNSILDNSYQTFKANEESNLFSKSDYRDLLKIDLSQEGKFIDFYNRLRALSHEGYHNAYFMDPDNKKVFLDLKICREQ